MDSNFHGLRKKYIFVDMYIRQSSVHTYIVEFLIYWFHPTHENWYTKNIIALTIHLDKGQDYID
jgi:hypothetical protein